MDHDSTIEQLWETYRRGCISAAAPQAQIGDMKISFFCGVSAGLGLVQALAEANISRARVDAVVDQRFSELAAFCDAADAEDAHLSAGNTPGTVSDHDPS